MTTNETLIEEKIRALVKELFYLAHVDYDENMAEANMTPPDEEGVRIIKGFLDSALQAKEDRIREETLEEIRDILTSEGGGVDSLYKFLGFERSASKDKLSNLSK